jgi:hypothetical protein
VALESGAGEALSRRRRVENLMKRLIVTFDDSAAGALRGAVPADCVIPFGLCFVWGQLRPANELKTFLLPRAAQPAAAGFHWLDNLNGDHFEEARKQGVGLIEFCERFETIELWADPEPNAQLQLVWLLDHIRSHADVVSKTALFQTDTRIGDDPPPDWAEQRRTAVPIRKRHLETASAAWASWRAATPVAWFDLLARDLTALPQLRSTVVALLEELPARVTGLGATEMRMLELLAAGHVHSYDLFPGRNKPNERRTFGYWQVGELLDGLAHCPAPAITGLDEGPFDDELHDATERHNRYKNGRLALTSLGKAILAQADDFSRHNPIHRWWGGTELTNDRLWRWDLGSCSLVAP